MMSNGGSLPTVMMVETLQANNEIIKENLLLSIQANLKKVQNAASHLLPDEKLQESVPEVLKLCESLFQALSHGLSHLSQSYWQFVKEFTLQNTLEYIQTVQQSKNAVGLSYAWLCTALNENFLESYFRSFVQNQNLIEKYYRKPALLRDKQRMQVLITMVAGLEFVPFQLSVQIEFTKDYFKNVLKGKKEIDIDCDSNHSDKVQIDESSPTSVKSIQEADSGVVDFENGCEIIVGEDKPVNFNRCMQKNDGKCNCLECEKNLCEERKRISHIINIGITETDDCNIQTTDMEVIRAKVVRRCKRSAEKSLTNKVYDESKQSEEDINLECSEKKLCSRFSKLTTDSGLSIDDDECCDDKSPIYDVPSKSFNVKTFQRDLDFSFCAPDRSVIDDTTNDINWWAERGAPEGQEDPISNIDCPIHEDKLSLKITDIEKICIDDEISIYDLNNKYCDKEDNSTDCSYDDDGLREDNQFPSVENNFDNTGMDDDDSICTLNNDISNMEESAIKINEDKDYSINVGNNILLYLTLEIFEEEDQFYKMFTAVTGHLDGTPEIVFIILTNKFLYCLRSGNKEERLRKEASIRFSEINYIYVGLNYQEFQIVCIDNQKNFQICTGNENLTRSIISNLEIVIRRSGKKASLPCVFTDTIAQKAYLKEFIAEELNCEASTVELYYYALVHWESYVGHSSFIFSTPGGPHYEGFLMYRFYQYSSDQNPAWKPGYFVLKNGVLYCFDSKDCKEVTFFVQLCVPHCKGCRRLPYADRPHTFEILISSQDSLQLAAADDESASLWLQSFLQAVCQAGHFLDAEPTYRTCCLVLSNDSLLTFQCKSFNKGHKLLGCANMLDLLKVYVEVDILLCCILEFESGEADRCSGEWILFFGCSEEKQRFLKVLRDNWEELHEKELPTSSIKDLSLLDKCKEMSHRLMKERLSPQDIFQEFE